jgi:hypothetical protein
VLPIGTGSCDWQRRRSGVPAQSPTKGVRGLASAKLPPADKAAALSPTRATARAWQPIGPKPAPRRQARSRRRPDDREVVRRLPWTRAESPAPGGSRSRTPAGFPRRSASSLRRCCFVRVLVTRNVGCRSGFEASGRHVRGKPQGLTRRGVEPRRRSPAWTGSVVIPRATRVLRACEGRKAGARPSVRVSSHFVGARSSPHRIRERRAGSSSLPSSNPARGIQGPGSGTQARSPGGHRATLRGDIARPRRRLFVRSPSRWVQGARDRWTAPYGPMSREGPASRLQGRKTLASLSGLAAARTAAPRGGTDGERRCHTCAASACGGRNGRTDR